MTPDEEARLQAELEALRKPMLRKRFYTITWTAVDGADPDEVRRIQPSHIRWQLQLEAQGVLFGSGALFDEHGDRTPRGLTIVRAESTAEARALAESEPYVTRGLRTFTIGSWVINEGSLTVRVNFGTGRFEFA